MINRNLLVVKSRGAGAARFSYASDKRRAETCQGSSTSVWVQCSNQMTFWFQW